MKKIFILVFLLNFSASSAFSACSPTGGACAIDDLKQPKQVNTEKNILKNNSQKQEKDKNSNSEKQSNFDTKKQYDKNK
ncbi:hypothetical protein IJ707_07460 [bacterium]|nr:hypothetical protein [bacterium]